MYLFERNDWATGSVNAHRRMMKDRPDAAWPLSLTPASQGCCWGPGNGNDWISAKRTVPDTKVKFVSKYSNKGTVAARVRAWWPAGSVKTFTQLAWGVQNRHTFICNKTGRSILSGRHTDSAEKFKRCNLKRNTRHNNIQWVILAGTIFVYNADDSRWSSRPRASTLACTSITPNPALFWGLTALNVVCTGHPCKTK